MLNPRDANIPETWASTPRAGSALMPKARDAFGPNRLFLSIRAAGDSLAGLAALTSLFGPLSVVHCPLLVIAFSRPPPVQSTPDAA